LPEMSRKLLRFSRHLVSDIEFCTSRQKRQVVRRATTIPASLPRTSFAHWNVARTSDTVPVNVRYGSTRHASTAPPEPPKKPRKVTTLSIASKKRRGHKITMVTAYDYPSAVHVDRAGIDVVLVGDSCAMVELGFETTQVRH
jgi:hypothetical protein